MKSAFGLEPRFAKIPRVPCLHLGHGNTNLEASLVFVTWFIRTDATTIYLFADHHKARIMQHLMETLPYAHQQEDGNSAIVLNNAKRIEFLDSRHNLYPSTVWHGDIDLNTPTATITQQISPSSSPPIDFLLVCGDVVGEGFPPNSLRACEIFFASQISVLFTFRSKLFASLDTFAHSTQRLGK